MQKARLIISDLENPLVDAEDCDESYFRKGLQCPTCKGLVFWKSLHTRYIEGNEQIVRATFAHSPSAPSNCPERNNSFDHYGEGETNNSNFLYQNSKKYEDAVLKCLHYHQSSKVNYYNQRNSSQILDKKSLAIQVFINEKHLEKQVFVNYCSESKKICSNPHLFIEAASKILNSNQAFKYLEAEAKKMKQTPNQTENIVTNIKNLIGIIGYLQNGGSDKFRQQFICKAIMGSPRLSIPTNHLWTDQEIRILQDWLNLEIVCDEQVLKNQRLSEIEIIESFTNPTLRRIRDNQQFLADKLNNFTKDPKSSKSKFVRFVLLRTWEAIKNCDWSIVPILYVW